MRNDSKFAIKLVIFGLAVQVLVAQENSDKDDTDENKNCDICMDLLQEERIETCILRICNGDIDEAVEKFVAINGGNQSNVNLVSNIAYSAFTSCADPNADANIITFVERSNIRNESNFYYVVRALYRSSGLLIAKWVDHIRTNSSIAQILYVNMNYRLIFNNLLVPLIKQAYASNRENAQQTVKFIRSLPDITTRLVALETLLGQMENDIDSAEYLLVVVQLKELMESPDYGQLTQTYKDQANALKLKLPTAVQGLIWNGLCNIKNRKYGEYLYAADNQFNKDQYRRRVFTWREEWQPTMKIWRILPILDKGYFSILSTIRNPGEYLYAATDELARDEHRRSVFTWIPGGAVHDQGVWRITPLDNATFFKLHNVNFNYEPLYADTDRYAYDAKRRLVFTRRTLEALTEVYQWEISC